jgi:hypothetical protein
MGDWVGSSASLDNVEKRNVSCTCRESNPEFLAVRPSRYTYWAIPGHNELFVQMMKQCDDLCKIYMWLVEAGAEFVVIFVGLTLYSLVSQLSLRNDG